MSKQLEKPFEYLRRKKEEGEKEGAKFDDEIIKNWYRARAYVLERLKDIAFKPDDKKHLHVVLNGDSDLMLAVARQVALSAHYINHDEENIEENKRNRTVITIVNQNKEDILKTLKDESCLCNLLNYGKYKLCDNEAENIGSYIDVEFLIVNECPSIDPDNPNEFLINETDVISFCNSKFENEVYSIDTRKAVYAGHMYDLGTLIENLPAENIHDANRYSLALDVFQFDKLQEPLSILINDKKWNGDQVRVKNGLSNVFCADCFESRVASIELCRDNNKQKDTELWAKYNKVLSKSEHARWIVEKLIMGFRPLNEHERKEDERLAPYKTKRKEYRNGLKKDEEKLAHIDLCSYNDLRRINPDDMKYDSFLMLAIPKILETIRKDDE